MSALNVQALQRFLSRYPDEGSVYEDPDAPRAIFPTACQLNRQQEDELVAEADRRLTALKVDLGWNATRESNWWGSVSPALVHQSSPAHTFFGKRDLASLIVRGQVDWRPFVYGGIFLQTNLHIPLTRKHTRQLASRAKNYFFGTEPWFSLLARFSADEAGCTESYRVADWQCQKAKAVSALSTAVDLAFDHGENIIKPLWKDWRRYYRQFAEVAHWNSKPIMLPNGDYIYRDDQWATNEEGAKQLVRHDLEEPFAVSFEELARFQWETKAVMRERIVYRGLELANMYYKDVLVTPTAPKLPEAREIAHLYDKPRTDLATQFLAHMAKSGNYNEFPSVLRMLRNLSNSYTDFHSGQARPRPELRESAEGVSAVGGSFSSLADDNCQFCEMTMDVDADGDGYSERIVLLYDVQTKYPIAYDYLDNVRPKGHEAFSCIRVNPVPGRWHGVGQVEIFWQLQQAIDLFINRMNFGVSREGRIDIIRKNAFLNLDTEDLLPLNGGETLELHPSETLENAFQSIYLNENIRIDHLFMLVEFLQQAFVSLAGTMGLNDAEAAGLDSAKLATGIRKLDRDQQEMFAPLLNDLTPGMEDIVRQIVDLIDANISKTEVLKFFEDDQEKFAAYMRRATQDSEYDIEIVLTKYQAEQELAQEQAGIDTCKDFLAQMPEVRQALAYKYAKLLELFQDKNAREVVAVLSQIPPMLPAQTMNVDAKAVANEARAPDPSLPAE